MKTAKKLLCVMIVLVMALGMIPFASAQFTDQDAIVYDDAVGLLVALGVIDGMGDGSFNPKGFATRAEIAVIICRCMEVVV